MKLNHGKGIIVVILGMSLQMGNTWGEVDTFGIDGIQGRHIAEYFEQRQTKGGMLPNYFMWGGV